MPTLSSLSSLRLHLGVPSSDTSEDTALTQFLTQAEALIRKYVRQAWAVPATSYTQYLNGLATGRRWCHSQHLYWLVAAGGSSLWFLHPRRTTGHDSRNGLCSHP